MSEEIFWKPPIRRARRANHNVTQRHACSTCTRCTGAKGPADIAMDEINAFVTRGVDVQVPRMVRLKGAKIPEILIHGEQPICQCGA